MKLVFHLKEFTLPPSFGSALGISDDILSNLQENKQYVVKSNVSEIVFQSFINYLINNDIPEINDDNISEYDELSEEFNCMENIINLYKLKAKNETNFSLIMQNTNLKKQIEEKKQQLQKNKNNYDQITQNLLEKYFGNCTFTKFPSDKQQFLYICTHESIDNVKNYLKEFQQKIVTQNELTFSLDEENLTATLTDCGEKGIINIPSIVNYQSREFNVTNYQNIFFDSKNIKKITFSKDIQIDSIYNHSFMHSSVRYLSISPSVSEIGDFSFSMSKIKMIEFQPDSKLKKIGKFAFFRSNVEAISIPSTVEEFGEGWCKQTNKLEKINIMENNDVQNIQNFKDLVIGKSIIDSNLFDVLHFASREVVYVKIPQFIRIISAYAFDHCEQLKFVEFDKNSQLEIIEKFAFSNCSLGRISIPKHVKIIEEGVFSNCEYLYQVNFDENSELQLIEKDAFENTSIQSISIPKNVTQIYENTFYLCKSLKEVEFSNDSELKTINKNAFLRSSIEKLTIPSTFVQFCKGWRNGTEKLSEIQIVSNNNNNPNIINYKDQFILGKSNSKNDTYDVLLFANQNLVNVKVPPLIKQIASGAFYHCNYNIKIEKHSLLELIDDYAFSENNVLEEIFIPSHVKKIGDHAFCYCENLKRVEFNENSNLESIGRLSFAHSLIENFVVPPKVTRIGELAFSMCSHLRRIEMPENLKIKELERYTFTSTALESISIPSCVEIIGDNVFTYCKYLKKVEFSANSKLKIIGENAFQESAIESIEIPMHVTKICPYAFSCCGNLEKVIFSDQSELRIIEKGVFSNSYIKYYSFPCN